MKKIFPLLLSIVFALSCNNEIDISAEYKETPIIYGLLNIDDTEHYIKIYRAFLDETTGSLEVAQNPDSIYYSDSVIVSIERKSGGNKTFLQRVILPNNLQEGIFAESPNVAYKFLGTLNPNETYVLRFENPKTGKTVITETPIVNDFQVNAPIQNFKFNFNAANPLRIEWRSAKNSRVTDVFMRIFYKEWNINTPNDVATKFVDVNVARSVVSDNANGGEQLSADFAGSIFYSALASQLDDNIELRRSIDEFPIQLYFNVGGEELYNFIRVNQAQGGITSLQTLPEYTNIDGGLGIFSSRKSKMVANIGYTNQSLDSLVCGSITRNLNFVNKICQ